MCVACLALSTKSPFSNGTAIICRKIKVNVKKCITVLLSIFLSVKEDVQNMKESKVYDKIVKIL